MDLHLPDAIAILERTPRTLEALLSGLTPTWTDANEGPDTWSPYIIVGHLIHGERTDWIPRARIILEQGPSRRFTPYDRFAQFEESAGKSLTELLDEFAHLRSANVGILEEWNLTEEQLGLTGEHPEFGTSDAAATAGYVGHARSVASGAGDTSDGQAMPRRGRAVAGLPAGDGPLSAVGESAA